MKKPRLGSYNAKEVEIYIAADTLSMMFGKTRCCNTIAFDRACLNYNQVASKDKGSFVQARLNSFDEIIDRVVGDQTKEWGKYHCDLHIRRNEYGPYVLADAGFFSIKVYTDKKGHFVVKYYGSDGKLIRSSVEQSSDKKASDRNNEKTA